ncbi:MAG: glycosyltransferase family 9 protein [Candidatus Omnitrophica bacterium]|nr:glycosyltransferase family 9 protein [Candidatus Omnitrophota bacterium]
MNIMDSRRILVVTLSNLGDVILTTPVFAALRETFPAAEISAFVGPKAADLFQDHPWVCHVYVYEKKASLREKLDLIMRIRRESFDLVVDLRHSLLSLFISPGKSTSIFRWRGASKKAHAVDTHLSILGELEIPAGLRNPFPLFGQEHLERARALFQARKINLDEPFFVIVPGARSHLKRWPAKRFKAVARLLREHNHAPIVLLGDKQERTVCNEIGEDLENFVFNLCGETTIGEFAAILGSAGLVVTNDSAALHLADLQDRRLVAIFGPTDEKRYGPRNPRARIVRKELFCSPCGLAQCPYKHECLDHLSVEEIFRACADVLQEDRLVTL